MFTELWLYQALAKSFIAIATFGFSQQPYKELLAPFYRRETEARGKEVTCPWSYYKG